MSLFRDVITAAVVSVVIGASGSTAKASISECRQLLMSGEYEACRDTAAEAIQRRAYGEDWSILKLRAEREMGQPLQALETVALGIKRYPWSVRLHLEARQLFLAVGNKADADASLNQINRLATATPWRYSDADDLVALGKAALAAGADPKAVLSGFFNRARKNFKRQPDGVLASAELALEKRDFQFAAELLKPAIEAFPDNPEILFAYGRAVRTAKPALTTQAISAVLALNPHYTPALIQLANQQIDKEQFPAAANTIARIRGRDPHHPQACAVRAAIHQLLGEQQQAAAVRQEGLHHYDSNPAVDYHIGEILSRRYRFKEGAARQRKALELDPRYQPAQAQLAQDLLRLGNIDEGWSLAEAAHEQDGYDTQLFNLLQLRDSMDRFATLRDENIELHMQSEEAQVYGTRAQRLLNDAWQELTRRYNFTPATPVIVEIYDRPDDFAVRTFGLPDVTGFLGVCFGSVVTANSPVSRRGTPTNWEAVLWHEFCHVITLQMTGNRIPRWLSEGISVYEERRQNPAWGQRMSPMFRDRILEGKVTPVDQLSSAFLDATSGGDINFAYYQSSMLVQYFVEQFGHESLLAVLQDLNNGVFINDALERNSTDIDALNEDFAAWLQQQAEEFAQGVSFTPDVLKQPGNLFDRAASHPEHYPIGLAAARSLIKTDEEAAVAELQRLVELFPEDSSAAGARVLLSQQYRSLGRTAEETSILQEHLQLASEDLNSAVRLFELHLEADDTQQALETAKLVLAIDPARGDILRPLASLARASGQTKLATDCLHALIVLDSLQAPRWRLQIAQLIADSDPVEARRQTLLALESAPRFREAHRFLLQLTEETETPAAAEAN